MENNYSDSQSAGSDASGANYFTATALNREEARDEALDVLKLVAESDESTEEAKSEATAKISQIAVDIQNEANIESLIVSKGFSQCVAVLNDESASIVVKAEGSLTPAQLSQINEIVYVQTGILPENITIIQK